MAVPTIYYSLIKHFNQQSQEEQNKMREACKKFRLMVSGSAALPTQTFDKWQQISGHRLLERFGMTEIGMGLSNSYKGSRIPGYVGIELPGVQVKLIDEKHQFINESNVPGEILVKSQNIFKEYYNNPKATQNSFWNEWFLTGDIAFRDAQNENYYKILGRASQDIIKSGGYKISALEIENEIRNLDWIDDVTVIGMSDEKWGEVVAAAICVKSKFKGKTEQEINNQIKDWLHTKIANYKVPKIIIVLDELPKNAMGKVVKPTVKEILAKCIKN